MKKGFKSILLLLVVYQIGLTYKMYAQDTTTIKPIAIDKDALSGLNLNGVKNKSQPNRLLFQSDLFLGEEIGVFVVASETATADWDNYRVDEFIFVLNGRARLKPKNNEQVFFDKGDFFIAPKGYHGIWETQGGESYYHELAVIALNREKDSAISGLEPVGIDKSKLNGINISKYSDGSFKDVLFEGKQLTVTTKSEKPETKTLNTIDQDQLVYVLAGKVTITSKDKSEQIFYTNDFFVLPKGFSGLWKSEGHSLFRSLHITKTK